MVAFTVVAVAAAVFAGRTPSPSQDASTGASAGKSESRQPVATGLSVLLVIGAVLVGSWTYRVGDIGSRAVWDPTDSIDFSDPGE